MTNSNSQSTNSNSQSNGDINSVDASKMDVRVLSTLIGKSFGVNQDNAGYLQSKYNGYGYSGWSTNNWSGVSKINYPTYGGWQVHRDAASAFKNLAKALEQAYTQLKKSFETLLENWKGAAPDTLKARMENFISSVQTLAHSVGGCSDIHSRQERFFLDLYSTYSNSGLDFYIDPQPDLGYWRFLASSYEMNAWHQIAFEGEWYLWLSPVKWGCAIRARVQWNYYSNSSHTAYKLYTSESAGNASAGSFGSVPKIPTLTNSGGGGTGGGTGGTGGGGSFVNELASLLPSLLLAPMSAMGMLSGLAGGLGKGTAGGNTLAGAQDPTPGAGSDPSASNSPSPGLIGTRVPNKSDLPSATNGFRFPPGWDGRATPTLSTPASGDVTADRATAQRPSDNASPTQGGGMPAMMPPMMGNRGGGGGQENSSSRSGLQKETAPIFTSDKDLPFSDDEWSTIITNLSGPSSNIELPNPNIPYMQRDH